MFGCQAILPVGLALESKPVNTLAKEYFCENPDIDEQFTRHLEVLKQAKMNIMIAQKKYKAQYDRRHVVPHSFGIGQQVLRKNVKRTRLKVTS